MYDIQKTAGYRTQYNRLDLRYRRFVDEAVEVIKQYPTDYQNRITRISSRKEGGLYRFRMPGCYLLYLVPERTGEAETTITLMQIKLM